MLYYLLCQIDNIVRFYSHSIFKKTLTKFKENFECWNFDNFFVNIAPNSKISTEENVTINSDEINGPAIKTNSNILV